MTAAPSRARVLAGLSVRRKRGRDVDRLGGPDQSAQPAVVDGNPMHEFAMLNFPNVPAGLLDVLFEARFRH